MKKPARPAVKKRLYFILNALWNCFGLALQFYSVFINYFWFLLIEAHFICDNSSRQSIEKMVKNNANKRTKHAVECIFNYVGGHGNIVQWIFHLDDSDDDDYDYDIHWVVNSISLIDSYISKGWSKTTERPISNHYLYGRISHRNFVCFMEYNKKEITTPDLYLIQWLNENILVFNRRIWNDFHGFVEPHMPINIIGTRIKAGLPFKMPS